MTVIQSGSNIQDSIWRLLPLNTHHQYWFQFMPKIRTNRTKKPPEGFEEIEGVSRLCPECPFVVGTYSNGHRSWMTTPRRCETLRTNLMKESARPSLYGPSCVYHIQGPGISTSCITSVRRFRRNFMNGF